MFINFASHIMGADVMTIPTPNFIFIDYEKLLASAWTPCRNEEKRKIIKSILKYSYIYIYIYIYMVANFTLLLYIY